MANLGAERPVNFGGPLEGGGGGPPFGGGGPPVGGGGPPVATGRLTGTAMGKTGSEIEGGVGRILEMSEFET